MIRPCTKSLPNGLRVICVEMPHLHSVELAVYFRVGGRNDPADRPGLSHFLEHIMFRGSADFGSSLEIEKAFESIGGAPNAATDADSTCYYSRVHPEHMRRGLEIFGSMLLRPLLEGVAIEKRIIAEEAREDLNEQGDEVNTDTIASRMLWPDHPLGMPTVGTLASIAAVTQADLRGHLDRFYVPSNAVVAVAGAVATGAVFSAVEDIFGQWPDRPIPATIPVPPALRKPEVRFVLDSDSQMSLQLAWLAFPRTDRRFMALRLLRRLLAGGGSSRLHLRLREELGIVYSVEASIGAYADTGCMAVDLSTAPATLTQAVEVTLEELLRVCTEPVPVDEMERVRQAYLFDLDFSRDSAYDIGTRYGWGELMGVARDIDQDRAEALAITPADLLDTARAVFCPENLRLVAVGPWKKTMHKKTEQLVASYAGRF